MVKSPNTSDQKDKPQVIIRRIEVNEDSHSGGAWKIALADMMTAMMAFFLVMWLISTTDTTVLESVADYFRPPNSVVAMRKGSDGIAGGKSTLSKTLAPMESTPAILTGQLGSEERMTIPSKVLYKLTGNNDNSEDEVASKIEKDTNRAFSSFGKNEKLKIDALLAKALSLLSEKKLSEKKSNLGSLADKIHIQKHQEGVLIQIIDTEDFSFFRFGTDKLEPPAEKILNIIADIVSILKSPLVVKGHTDSFKYSGDAELNNWTLSVLRADATRKYLLSRKVNYDQFEKIEGVADKNPLVEEDPFHPSNRRVEIFLKPAR